MKAIVQFTHTITLQAADRDDAIAWARNLLQAHLNDDENLASFRVFDADDLRWDSNVGDFVAVEIK